MTELLSLSLLPIVLTLAAFRLGQVLQQKFKSALLNPILIAVILVVLFLTLTGMPGADYQAGMKNLSWLLTPATISLAIPLYEQFQALKKNLSAIGAGIAAGALACLLMVAGLGILFGFDRELTVSLLPKSITTAIGVSLTELTGGIPSITTAAIIFTGILANIMGSTFCRLFRITDKVAQGVAFGTAGHVIGTTRANEIDPLTGAVSSLSLVVAGLLTAIVLPLMAGFIP